MSRSRPGPPPRGVRLGVDVGTVRVGVARSDPDSILATPVAALSRDAVGDSDLDRLREIVIDDEVVEVVVGLPRTLRGADGPAAQAARRYGEALAGRITPVPVIYVDERMTTVLAHRRLAERGVSGRDRRLLVDAAAAATILQTRLDQIRSAQPR